MTSKDGVPVLQRNEKWETNNNSKQQLQQQHHSVIEPPMVRRQLTSSKKKQTRAKTPQRSASAAAATATSSSTIIHSNTASAAATSTANASNSTTTINESSTSTKKSTTKSTTTYLSSTSQQQTPASTNTEASSAALTSSQQQQQDQHNYQWSKAIHSVMRAQKVTAALKASTRQRKDGLGLALHRIINQRKDIFSYQKDPSEPAVSQSQTMSSSRRSLDDNNGKREENDDDDDANDNDNIDTFCYPPLLSRHNARVLAHRWQQWRYTNPRQALWELLQNSFRIHNPSSSSLQPSREQTVRFALILASLLIILVGCTGSVVTVVAGHAAWQVGTACLLFLIDWRDLQALLPSSWVEHVTRAAVWMDQEILRAKVYQFREWTASEFESSSSITTFTIPSLLSFIWSGASEENDNDESNNHSSSLTKSLWELPPPTIKEGGRRLCLDRKFLQRPSWSPETVDHILAIDFCYVMMRENVLVQHARRRRGVYNRSSSVDLPQPSSNGDNLLSSNVVLPAEDGVVVALSNHQASSEAIELQVSASVSQGDQEMVSLSGSDYLLDDEPGSPASRRSYSSVNSSSSDIVSELPWLDVGAKIGMRLLNSAHVSRAVASQETTERLMASSKDLLGEGTSDTTSMLLSSSSTNNQTNTATREPLLSEIVLPSIQVAGGSAAKGIMKRKPVHSLWTSPGAAASATMEDPLWSSPPTTPNSSRPTSPNSYHRNKYQQQLPPKSPASPTSMRGGQQQQQRRFLLTRRHSEEDLLVRSPGTVGSCLSRSDHDDDVDDGDVFSDCYHSPKGTVGAGLLTSPGCITSGKNDTVINGHPAMRRRRVRQPLAPGVRVAVPIIPVQPALVESARKNKKHSHASQYQIGWVVRSERIWVSDLSHTTTLTPNCLSVTVKLERSFLRNGEFANLTFRVMDHWPDRYMPKHSKAPVGSCVATTFGVGVLVGWRVEDDCHIVRSLWRRRGAGSGHAYLNRHAIHSVVEAAVGFQVETRHGSGQVVSYVNGGPKFEQGRYSVNIPNENDPGHLVEMPRRDIFSCHGSQFIPVTEHIREAAHFQMQLDIYRDWVAQDEEDDLVPVISSSKLETLTSLSEIVWNSFLKAVDEDKDFDDGVNHFMTSVIDFLERLDGKGDEERDSDVTSVVMDDMNAVECVATSESEVEYTPVQQEPGFWFTNDILGGVFGTAGCTQKSLEDRVESPPPVIKSPTQVDHEARSRHFERLHAFLHTLLKTVSYARVASVDKAHFRLGLAITYDVLLFFRTIVKVQQKNVSVQSLRVWKRAFEEIWSTIEPIKDRLQRIGRGIAQRMEQQGRKAKTKVIKFVDTVLGDERLLIALEQGDWDRCVKQLEAALVQSKILERENLVYYRKTLTFLYNHVRLALSNNQGAARRNSEKIAFLAQVIQWVAAPRRSLLKLFERDDVLDFFERILVRVFHKEELASRKVVIHALNFHSLRHLRMLKDFSTSGRLWMPVLDAADEEFSWMVSNLPQNTKDIMGPISSLFSLCVAQFHRIAAGDLTKDWMDFLLEEDAVRIIHDIDMKLILALESLSRDVKDMMVVLPYYSNIDDDILNLMDEVDLDEFLKEASDAMDDPDKLTQFIREKATIAIQRFLDWLPRISIPVEKRELMEGWVLTCRGEDGGDLTLSDVSVKKDNLVCQIMGGDALFFPMFGDETDEDGLSDEGVIDRSGHAVSSTVIEESVLDHIREMLLQAERYGCWKSGVGGVGQPPSDRYVASVLQGLPVSAILNCAIEMWRNLEIDDDELLEIAVKDVSYHIQLQKIQEEKENGHGADSEDSGETELVPPSFSGSSIEVRITDPSSTLDGGRNRFNPRIDPTVLFLDMKNLTLRLENFMFRIEKNEKSLLDPVFEGKGSLTIQNVSIRIRVECAKERIRKTTLGETFAPVLILKELTTSLEEVILRVRDTAFGSDWLLNKVVQSFERDITKVVEENLREQVEQQAKKALENLNAYFLVNPNMLLNLLGITLADLDDNVIWV